MKTINKRTMLGLLEAAATKRPNRIVELCRYTNNGKSCCLVGSALIDELDPTLYTAMRDADSSQGEFFHTGDMQASAVLPLLKNYGYKFTRGAIKVAQAAQESQDSLHPWQEAYETAKAA